MSIRHRKLKRARYYASQQQDPECWCGVKNPYYAPVEMNGCGGYGTFICHCGGDQCVCHNHGEVECPGCDHCEPDLEPDYSMDDLEWSEAHG